VKIFRERAKVEAVVLTRGADGMTIFDPAEGQGTVTHIPTVASQVFDVSGAGDTVVAALALALACGASVTTAARIGNAAAGIAVSKRGTAVVHADELSAVLGAQGAETIRKSSAMPPLPRSLSIGRPKG
jgi:D-beta-D-heptose 7-phosphate kinase/D-beta-D-heptose 1-phosphate adenosyltransferase